MKNLQKLRILSSKPRNVKIVDKRCENTEELKIISANIKMTIIDLGIV